MIPKRQHMEQTTEGTISYLLSISWSHLSPTSAKPSSWLVEVMLTEVKGRGGGGAAFRGAEEGRGDGWRGCLGWLDHWASPIETHLPVNRRKSDGGRGQEREWMWEREDRREWLLIAHFKSSAVSADRAVSMHTILRKETSQHSTATLTTTAADEMTAE